MGNQSILFADEIPTRKTYFEEAFFRLASQRAKQLGVPLRTYLAQITDLNSFKKILADAFSLEISLENYFDGLRNEDFDSFFERRRIQEVVRKGEEVEIEKIPIKVRQVEKRTQLFFRATIKGKRVIAKKEKVKVKGKPQVRFRNPRTGRFASIK